MTRYCGGKTRAGGECRREAGWATDHVGYGRCKLHGGRAPAGRKAAARERAVAEGRRYIDEVDVDPARAMLSAVRLHAGIRQHYLEALAELNGADGDETKAAALVLEVRATNRELSQIAKACADAGVADRMVRMAERMGAMLSAAMEDALAVLGDVVTPELRAKVVRTYVARLESLEGSAEELDDVPALPPAA